MRIALRPVAAMAAIFTLCVFSGAFFEQAVFGPEYIITPSAELRAVNSLFYFVAYGLGLLFLLMNRRVAAIVLREYSFFLLFCVVALLSISWSLSPSIGLVEFGQLLLTVLTAGGVVAGIDFRGFIRAMAFTFLIIAALSLLYVLVIPSYGIMYQEFSRLSGTPQGVFRHKNTFGEAAVYGVIVAFAARRYVAPWVWLSTAIGSAICLAISLSATKVLAFAVTLMIFFAWQVLAQKRGGRVFAVVALALGSLTLGVMMPILLQLGVDMVGRDLTFSGRTHIWAHTLDLIADRPFIGYGVASIWNTQLGDIPALPNFASPHAHNVFLEITLSLGVIGLVIAILALGRIGLRLFTAQDTTSPSYVFLFLVFFFTLISSFFEYLLFGGNKFSFLMLLMASGYHAVEQARGRRGGTYGSMPRTAATAP